MIAGRRARGVQADLLQWAHGIRRDVNHTRNFGKMFGQLSFESTDELFGLLAIVTIAGVIINKSSRLNINENDGSSPMTRSLIDGQRERDSEVNSKPINNKTTAQVNCDSKHVLYPAACCVAAIHVGQRLGRGVGARR